MLQPNYLIDNWLVTSLVQGIKRDQSEYVERKLPITPENLRQFITVLNLSAPKQMFFWSVCLVAFNAILRKSSMFPRQASMVMLVKHCSLHSWGMSISVTYSKTIQRQERSHSLCLLWHPDHRLCLVRNLIKSLKVSSCRGDQFIFSFYHQASVVPMTYAMFNALLKSTLVKLNIPISRYSGHSFRRGGATHAVQQGVQPVVIKEQGDWKSLAYDKYLNLDALNGRADLLKPMMH